MQYAIARYNTSQRELAYCIYVTDLLNVLTSRGQGLRWYDAIGGGKPKIEITAEQAVASIKNKFRS